SALTMEDDYITDRAEISVTCQEITFEEAVIQKMNYDNISYEEAEAYLLSEENRILNGLGTGNTVARTNSLRSSIIHYVNYEKTFDYPRNSNFSCAINATIVTVSDYANSKFIDRVDMMSTRRISGEYNYQWVQQSISHTISSDRKNVRLAAAGHFSITSSVDISVSGFGAAIGTGQSFTYLSIIFNIKCILLLLFTHSDYILKYWEVNLEKEIFTVAFAFDCRNLYDHYNN
ncbi:MAG: hypothetical protein RR705_10965, partial [Lachnospiraceae bacterium]